MLIVVVVVVVVAVLYRVWSVAPYSACPIIASIVFFRRKRYTAMLRPVVSDSDGTKREKSGLCSRPLYKPTCGQV